MRKAATICLILLVGCVSQAQDGDNRHVDASYWMQRLTSFSSLPATGQAAVLKDLPELLKSYSGLRESVENSGIDPKTALSQQTRAASGKPGAVGVEARLKRLQAIPSDRNQREGEPMSWFMAMGANALDLGLASTDHVVRTGAQETLRILFADIFRPAYATRATCITGWQYGWHSFVSNVNSIFRDFAAKNWPWFVANRQTSEEFNRNFQLFSAERHEGAFKAELAAMLESKKEETVDLAIACLVQWPDDQFLPHLERLMTGEHAALVSSDEFGFVINRYGVRAIGAVRRVWDRVDNRNREALLEKLSYLPCQPTWEFFLECLRSSNIYSRAAAIRNLWSLPGSEWDPSYEPQPSTMPKDVQVQIDRLVGLALKDPAGLVRISAARHLDKVQMPDSFWRGIARDPSPDARSEVSTEFDRMSADLGWALLFSLAQDPIRRVRHSALYRAHDVPGAAGRALNKKSSTDPSERAAAVLIVGHIGEPDHLDQVAAFLKDPVPSVRAAAMHALGEFEVGGLDRILAGCGDSSEEVVKAAAEAATIVYSEDTVATLGKMLKLVRPQYRQIINEHIAKVETAWINAVAANPMQSLACARQLTALLRGKDTPHFRPLSFKPRRPSAKRYNAGVALR
ncbi:MAG: HEAT repeat domain-containing protein [Chlorobia bacterium]|nr:HEAT repeat domain-containing protein [Fimbriimonadaceae bacterium]